MWIKRFVGVALLSGGLIAASALPATAEPPMKRTDSFCYNSTANEEVCFTATFKTKSTGAVCTRRCLPPFAPLPVPNSIEDYTLHSTVRYEDITYVDGAVVSESKHRASYNIRVRDGEVQVLTYRFRISEEDCRYTTRLVIANNVVRSDVRDEPCA